MKKTFFITGFLLGAFNLAGFISQAQTCPQIQFGYDATGNRVQRQLVIVSCGGSRVATVASKDSVFSIQANVYPNPAQDKINIELQNDEAIPESNIFLYDLNGREIYSETTALLLVQVDVSKLSPGTYLLKVVRGKDYKTYNVSKN